MKTRKKTVAGILERSGVDPSETPEMSDAELLHVIGVGRETLKAIRKFWRSGAAPTTAPVYHFGLKTDAEKAKRGGLWHDMSQIDPELWGPLQLRLRSSSSTVVMIAVDKAELEIRADMPGQEALLAKIREEVNGDTGDRSLSAAVLLTSMGALRQMSRQQQLELAWRRALASIRAVRGTADFGSGETTLTGEEPAEEVQALLGPTIELSSAHSMSITRLVFAMDKLEDAEIVSLGEGYVVTEKPSAL